VGNGRHLQDVLRAALILVAGCSAPLQKPPPPLFFPPPPALPRIQYLTSFSGLRDIEPQSGFDRFIVGEKQDLKVDKPYGVALHDGKIYVCDTNSTVAVFDLKGKTFGPLAGAVGQGTLRQPINITIDGDGTKYVADALREQVVVFDRDDRYVRAYGTPGDWRPVDAAPFGERLYVADAANGLVKIFDKRTGEMLSVIGNEGDPAERLDRPTNLAFDRDGYLYVTDVGRFQVVKYDRDGHLKRTFGRPGDNLGHFARPKGIALDRDGLLYAVDASFNNVQIFNAEGRLLMFFADSGNAPGGLLLPAKVTIDYDNVELFREHIAPGFRAEYLVVVTSQFGDRRVNVFAYGREEGKEYPSDDDLRKLIEERRAKERQPSAPQ